MKDFWFFGVLGLILIAVAVFVSSAPPVSPTSLWPFIMAGILTFIGGVFLLVALVQLKKQ